ncbi:MAG TPA: Lrp/AsnC family transcriptional regulator [Flavipsychrobacter sp.]|nr:Lrp/AsnC family transcriptional regulator [Flavipsychrobacter sp.]
MHSLDKNDKHILTMLQENAHQTHKEIARKLGMSLTATYERIKRLEKLRVIKKYVALVDREKVGKGLLVLCQISLKEQSHDKLKGFERSILKLEEIIECYYVAGNYDFLLKIVSENMTTYQNFVITKLSTLPNVANVQSTFIMSELKYETAIGFISEK